MKMRLLGLCILIIIYSVGFPQSCVEYALYLDTQEEVDNFQINYPGCTQIEGSLYIYGNVTNLNGLSVLVSVGDYLAISYCNSLQNLQGLNNLAYVGQNVDIDGNYSLINLEGLNNLTSVGRSLVINENFNLINLSGLDNLTDVAKDIWIAGNPSLVNLAGLDKLEDVSGQIVINGNHNLLSLTGLENLTAISGGIRIDYNYDLASLAGLNNLETIGLDLIIESCFSLLSLSGLESLNYVGGDLILRGIYIIPDLNGLNNLSVIGSDFIIESIDEISNLYGLGGLDTINGNLTITELEFLQNLSGLSNLKKIGDGLIITDNDTLTSLDGMDALFNVIGPVEISGNNILTSLQGLENIQQGTVTDLSIYDNAALTDCALSNICDYLVDPNGEVNIYSNATGCDNPGEIASVCGNTLPCLPFGNYYFLSQEEIDDFKSTYLNCTTIEGDVKIAGTDITNLDSLNDVVSIGGELEIWVNPLLANLNGLINTTYLGKSLFVAENPLLTSLSGVDNINLGENNTIRIVANPALSVCNQNSICDFIQNYQGLAVVYANAEGCYDKYQIAESCGILALEDFQQPANVEAFPNPLKTFTNISFTLPSPGPAKIYIFNYQGIKVDEIFVIQNNISHKVAWNASGRAPGIYFYKIITESQEFSGKMIVVN